MNNMASVQQLEATEEGYRKRMARIRVLRYACLIAAVGLIVWAVSPWYAIRFNGMHSIKGTFFILDKMTMPKHGDIAYFHPPKNKLYPKEMAFGKYVAGSPGDKVTIVGRNFFINGHPVGYAFPNTSTGEDLEMSQPGVIPESHYFMWGEHEKSYDSRYADIGWIHESRIVGRMYRIF